VAWLRAGNDGAKIAMQWAIKWICRATANLKGKLESLLHLTPGKLLHLGDYGQRRSLVNKKN